jgi:hypothetical protein
LATEIDRCVIWGVAPAVVLGGAIAVMLAAAPIAGHPMWQPRSLNLTEAAAARDVATIALLLERGEDPNARRPVRQPLLDGMARELTPLEAGVAAGRLEVVDLLLARGAELDDERRRALSCDALRRGYRDVAEFLAAPLAGTPCSAN